MTKMANSGENDTMRSRARNTVLHLLTGRVFGGAEEHALSILTKMRTHGFEPCLAAPNALIEAMEPSLSAAGVKCLPLEFSSRLDVLTSARLLRFIRRENIAILHCHLFTASLSGAGVARMAGVGAVLETCHGPEVWRMGKGLRASFWVDRQVGRLVDKYIAVSHAAERHLVGNKRVPKDKIRVIHNGRDLDRFASASPNRRIATRAALGLANEPALLTMARLDDQKGHRHRGRRAGKGGGSAAGQIDRIGDRSVAVSGREHRVGLPALRADAQGTRVAVGRGRGRRRCVVRDAPRAVQAARPGVNQRLCTSDS